MTTTNNHEWSNKMSEMAPDTVYTGEPDVLPKEIGGVQDDGEDN